MMTNQPQSKTSRINCLTVLVVVLTLICFSGVALAQTGSHAPDESPAFGERVVELFREAPGEVSLVAILGALLTAVIKTIMQGFPDGFKLLPFVVSVFKFFTTTQTPTTTPSPTTKPGPATPALTLLEMILSIFKGPKAAASLSEAEEKIRETITPHLLSVADEECKAMCERLEACKKAAKETA